MGTCFKHIEFKHSAACGHSGFVLFITLIMMVLMSIAGLAVLRAVDNANAVSINISLRQDALASADTGSAAAANWLRAQTAAALNQNLVASGYYAAASARGLDVLGDKSSTPADNVNWTDRQTYEGGAISPSPLTPADHNGNRHQWVIHRMCTVLGGTSEPGQSCATPSSDTQASGAPQGETGGGRRADISPPGNPYYRITVRTIGPRNTEVFTQTVLGI